MVSEAEKLAIRKIIAYLFCNFLDYVAQFCEEEGGIIVQMTENLVNEKAVNKIIERELELSIL